MLLSIKEGKIELTCREGNLRRELNIERQLWLCMQRAVLIYPSVACWQNSQLPLFGSWNNFSSLGVQTCTHLDPQFCFWLTVPKMAVSESLVIYESNVSSERIAKQSIYWSFFPASVIQLHSSTTEPWEFMVLSIDFAVNSNVDFFFSDLKWWGTSSPSLEASCWS